MQQIKFSTVVKVEEFFFLIKANFIKIVLLWKLNIFLNLNVFILIGG